MADVGVNDESTANKMDAKSGWMFNQERTMCCMKQWKRRWFVLDTDCMLRYFDRPENSIATGLMVLRKPYTLSDSSQMTNIDPPRRCSKAYLLKIETEADRLTLCCETPEDLRDWRNVLESIHGDCTEPPPVVHQVLAEVVFVPAYVTVIQSADNTKTTTAIVCQASTTMQASYQTVGVHATPVRAGVIVPVMV